MFLLTFARRMRSSFGPHTVARRRLCECVTYARPSKRGAQMAVVGAKALTGGAMLRIGDVAPHVEAQTKGVSRSHDGVAVSSGLLGLPACDCRARIGRGRAREQA